MFDWQQIKRTLQLGWPIILGNLSQMALGIIDSAMVGAIHSSQLAAASFVNNLIMLPLILSTGLTTAISPLAASSLGENDYDKPLRILYNGTWVVGLMSLAFATLLHFGADMTEYFGQDKIVAELSKPYLRWMGWSMIPMALFMAVKQYADGLGKTRFPMYLSLAVLPLNVIVNYAFIYGKWGAPKMELEGAGVGTLISRLVILISILILVFRHDSFAPFRQNLSDQLQFKWSRVRDVVRIGIPSSLQYGMESFAFAVSGIMAGWLGYVQQAAHQIAISISAMTFMVSIGISAAGSIRVAYAYGKRDWQGARDIGRTTIALAVSYGLFCALLLIIGRSHLPLLFNDEAKVLEYATVLMIMAAIFQISDSVQAVGVGLLRGLQDVRIPTLFVFIAYWAIGIPFGYWLAFDYDLQIIGLWVGLILGLSVSALLLTYRFRKLTRRSTAALTGSAP
jgi:MATE family multidrug resistance protein